jgi:hypothetical protein
LYIEREEKKALENERRESKLLVVNNLAIKNDNLGDKFLFYKRRSMVVIFGLFLARKCTLSFDKISFFYFKTINYFIEV